MHWYKREIAYSVQLFFERTLFCFYPSTGSVPLALVSFNRMQCDCSGIELYMQRGNTWWDQTPDRGETRWLNDHTTPTVLWTSTTWRFCTFINRMFRTRHVDGSKCIWLVNKNKWYKQHFNENKFKFYFFLTINILVYTWHDKRKKNNNTIETCSRGSMVSGNTLV